MFYLKENPTGNSLSLSVSPTPTPSQNGNDNLNRLKIGQITPDTKKCIIEKLGREEAQKFIQQFRESRSIPANYQAAIKSCLNSGQNN